MSAELLIAIVGAILLPLNGATLFYVVSIERRLTRLEAREEMRRETAEVLSEERRRVRALGVT